MNFWYIEYTVWMILILNELTQTYGLDLPLYL